MIINISWYIWKRDWEFGFGEVYSESVLIVIIVSDLFVGVCLNKSFIVENRELDGLKIVNLMKIVIVWLLIYLLFFNIFIIFFVEWVLYFKLVM